MHSLALVFTVTISVSEVNATDTFMFPTLAKRILIVQQRKLLYYVIHDKVDINRRLTAHHLFVGLTQLCDMSYIESLIGVQLQHAIDQST